jgi:hypothetical protein
MSSVKSNEAVINLLRIYEIHWQNNFLSTLCNKLKWNSQYSVSNILSKMSMIHLFVAKFHIIPEMLVMKLVV